MSSETKRRRLLWFVIAMPFILFGLLVFAALPGKNIYTVSPETTVATDHVGADGFVDNIAALNSRLRGAITPEQNANVLIWKAIGPHPEGGNMPDEYFQWLGAPAPPENGDYLINWTKFMLARGPVPDPADIPPGGPAGPGGPPVDLKASDEQRERARKWPWKTADEPDLAAWIAKNARPLEQFAKASTRPLYYNPLVPKRTPTGENGQLIGCLLPNVQVCREGGVLLVCRAMMRLGAGQPDEAWRDLMTCHRLGRIMEQGGTLIEYLVGAAIQHHAMQAEAVFLSQVKLTPAKLAACQADLRQLPAPSSVPDKVDLTERFCTLDVIQWLARSGPAAFKEIHGQDAALPEPVAGRMFSRSTDWDVTMRITNGWYDRTVAAMRIEDLRARELAMGQLEAELKTMSQEIKAKTLAAPLLGAKQRGDLFGRATVSLMFPATQKIAAVEVRLRQQHLNLDIAFALAAHRADKDKYPATLAELAPKYLPAIPKDLFANDDLKYRPSETGYLLYSVGPNRQDEDGRTRDDAPPGDDLAIVMPAKEPPPLEKPLPADLPQ